MESVAIGSGGAWRADARHGVPCDFDRLWTTSRGGSGGFCRDRWSIYGAKKSPDRVEDRETRAIELLPSRPRLGNYAKFILPFAKLSKIQTPNIKLLDTLFYNFWQITRIQTKCNMLWDCSVPSASGSTVSTPSPPIAPCTRLLPLRTPRTPLPTPRSHCSPDPRPSPSPQIRRGAGALLLALASAAPWRASRSPCSR